MKPSKARGRPCGNTVGPQKKEPSSRKAQREPRASHPRQQVPLGEKRHLAIYSGRSVLGYVIGDERRWEARSPNDNKLIGIYASWIEAANAITARVAS
jgi:hypothetical protein